MINSLISILCGLEAGKRTALFITTGKSIFFKDFILQRGYQEASIQKNCGIWTKGFRSSQEYLCLCYIKAPSLRESWKGTWYHHGVIAAYKIRQSQNLDYMIDMWQCGLFLSSSSYFFLNCLKLQVISLGTLGNLVRR